MDEEKTIETKEDFLEYIHNITDNFESAVSFLEGSPELVEGVNNIEFIFRCNMINDVAKEILEFF